MNETNKQMPLEIWTDINGHATRTQFNGGVKYIRAAEYDALREQNRVLADERNKLTIAIGQAIVTLRYYAKTAINVRAVNTLDRIEAALTATSQEGQHE